MSEKETPSTWYEIEREYLVQGYQYRIVPIQVVKQTYKCIIVHTTWEATPWQKAGSRDTRKLLNGDQFDNLPDAEVAVRFRLVERVTLAEKDLNRAKQNLHEWDEKTLSSHVEGGEDVPVQGTTNESKQ